MYLQNLTLGLSVRLKIKVKSTWGKKSHLYGNCGKMTHTGVDELSHTNKDKFRHQPLRGLMPRVIQEEKMMRVNRRTPHAQNKVRLYATSGILSQDIVSHLLGKLSHCDNLPHVTKITLLFQIILSELTYFKQLI